MVPLCRGAGHPSRQRSSVSFSGGVDNRSGLMHFAGQRDTATGTAISENTTSSFAEDRPVIDRPAARNSKMVIDRFSSTPYFDQSGEIAVQRRRSSPWPGRQMIRFDLAHARLALDARCRLRWTTRPSIAAWATLFVRYSSAHRSCSSPMSRFRTVSIE